MIGISCKEEISFNRYDYIRNKIGPDARLEFFSIDCWGEPWGFGKDKKSLATQLYNEYLEAIGEDTVNSISDNDFSDEVVVVLRSHSEDKIGIVLVAEDACICNENLIDLFNYVVKGNSAEKSTKSDNLLVNKMNLFNGFK